MELDRKVGYVRRPDVGLVTANERYSGIEVRRHIIPRFYCKRLFFGALVSEAVRQLSSFFGYIAN